MRRVDLPSTFWGLMPHVWDMTIVASDRVAGTARRGLSRAISLVLLAATLGVVVNGLGLLVASASSDHDTLAFLCNDDRACVSAGTVLWPNWAAAFVLMAISVALIVLAARRGPSRPRGVLTLAAVATVVLTLVPVLVWHG
jgi:hypothetical protein